MKAKFLLTVILLFALTTSCAEQQKIPGWKVRERLSPIWKKIQGEKVKKIIFCETDVKDINNWFVAFEVPDDAIDKSLQLIDKALKEKNVKRDVWDIKRMKIITNKGKYVFPINWTGEKIYGTDWLSYELREYLKQKRFTEPQ